MFGPRPLYAVVSLSLVAVAAFALSGCERPSSSNGRATTQVAAAASPTSPRTVKHAEESGTMQTEQATFAAGCFWGVEQRFREVGGVVRTTVGYTGGQTENPTYQQVCSDRTGHAEAVRVEFNPQVVTYAQLLDVFWKTHDPTTPNRQGPDVGSQYRSAIFYHTAAQQAAALASLQAQAASRRFARPIVTEIVAAEPFYPAEEYHQQYLAKRGKTSCASTVNE